MRFGETVLVSGGAGGVISSLGWPVEVPLDQRYLRDASLRGSTISGTTAADALT